VRAGNGQKFQPAQDSITFVVSRDVTHHHHWNYSSWAKCLQMPGTSLLPLFPCVVPIFTTLSSLFVAEAYLLMTSVYRNVGCFSPSSVVIFSLGCSAFRFG